MCLPVCPTYQIFEDENESPRGRIALIQGVINNQIKPDQKLHQHIDHCLTCRACERICPSGVKYSSLLDHGKQILNQDKKYSGLKKYFVRLGLKLSTSKNWQRGLQSLLYLYQRLGLQRLFRTTGLLFLLRLSRLDKLIPPVPRFRHLLTKKPDNPSKGKIGLFTGCTGNLFDQQTLLDTIYLLEKLGYEVVIPENQTCCGALHQHQGELEEAGRLSHQNIRAFKGLDTIIYIASGCGAQLKEYGKLSEPDNFATRCLEICQFLSKEDLSKIKLVPLPDTVCIHTPCSMRNALRLTDASYSLLNHIPDINLTNLPEDVGCCGAAGSYMLSQPELAQKVREKTLSAFKQIQPAIITTTNIGCHLHLNNGLSAKIKLMHPVSLLVRQIEKIN